MQCGASMHAGFGCESLQQGLTYEAAGAGNEYVHGGMRETK
jgi:hypothetical protein